MKNLIFAGICKNIEKNFSLLHDFVKNKPEDSQFFIYENNSTDNSVLLLKQLQAENLIKLKTENISNSLLLENSKARTFDNLPCRIESIARARNNLIDFINSSNSQYEYIAYLDLDFERYNHPSIIVETINRNKNKNWGGIACNGIDMQEKMYDLFAFRHKNFCLGPEVLGEFWWNNLPKIVIDPTQNNDLIEVESAFNGCAIYKKNAIEDLRYQAYPNQNLNSHYEECIKNNVNFHIDEYKKQLNNLKTHIEGACQGFFLFSNENRKGIFYKNNSGYAFPVVCEHVTFHADMLKRGHKLYIDPQFVFRH